MRVLGLKSLFVVLGPSGSGKSSFLRAGLLPRLHREDRRFLAIGIVRPERHPLTGDRGLAEAIHRARQELSLSGAPLGNIKTACLEDPQRVATLLAELRGAAAERLRDVAEQDSARPKHGRTDEDIPAPTIILPIDQAEELFAAGAGPQAEQFLTLLAHVAPIVNATDLGLIVAATIRTDRYAAMQNHPALEELATVLFNELRPMPVTQFKEVITGPASRTLGSDQPVRLAPDLVDRLLKDAGDGADTLPLLSLTLARLHDDWIDPITNELTLDDYEAMGGVRDVVNSQIEQILAEAPHDRPDALALLRSAFIPWLVTIDSDTDGPTRRVALEAELPVESRSLINAFVGKRLLVRDERDGQVVVEVALESLLREWQDLAIWLTAERQNFVAAADLERAAREWEKNDQDDAWLMEGTRLAAAESVADKQGFRDRLANTTGYLAASRKRDLDRRTSEKQRLRDIMTRRIVSDAKAMLSGAIDGGDALGLQLLMAAHALHPERGEGLLFDGLLARPGMRKIIDTGRHTPCAVAFSPDGQLLATVGADHTTRLWHADSGQAKGIPLVGHTDTVWDVAFSPDGRSLATAGKDRTVRLWNVESNQPQGVPLVGHADSVWSVAFSPDGRTLATASADRTVRLWDIDSGRALHPPLIGHTASVGGVTFSPDGRRLATASDDRTLRLWDVRSGTLICQPLEGHTDSVQSVVFSPGGRHLASGSHDGTIRFWDNVTGRPHGFPLQGHTDSVWSVAFSPDGLRLASAGADRTVRLWNTVTHEAIGDPLIGHTDRIRSVAFDPRGDRVVSGSDDNTLRVWDGTGRWFGSPIGGHTKGLTFVAFSPDGDRIATSSWDTTIRLWDATGRPVDAPIKCHTTGVSCVTFSPDGQTFASAGYSGKIRFWQAATGQRVGKTLKGHVGPVTSVAFSPDGALLASAGGNEIRIWDARTGELLNAPINVRAWWVSSVVFSPDGRTLASADSDGVLRLWHAATAKPVGEPLRGHTDTASTVAFRPDGRQIASGSSDSTIRIWDVETGAPVGGPLRAHTKSVKCLAFSSDGRDLASGSSDNTIRIWDTTSGRPLGDALTGHTGPVYGVAFSKNGSLASAGHDHTLRLWPGAPTPNMLCEKISANMSQRQWSKWVSSDVAYIPACTGLPIAPDDSDG